ncbi:TPA: type II toxin-antitoxin system RelE/ParE family toxin [Streptococcus suis]|nr:type II toxin-antitoxin system RelE/ParE family toxin [Streptococcus suis]
MENKHYELTFLPLFEQDLNEAVDYITNTLKSPQAALNLVDEVEKVIFERLKNPAGYAPFPTLKKRPYDYYTIKVRNFTIFYVLIDNTMEIRRILYSKRNFDKLI